MYAKNRFANKRKKKISPLPGALAVILFGKFFSFSSHRLYGHHGSTLDPV